MKAKLLCYLSILVLILPFSWAVGDTFGILQGSVDSPQELFFEIYLQENVLFKTVSILPQEGFYAVSITIPATYAQVSIVPKVNDIALDFFTLHSGEILEFNIFTKTNYSLNTSFEGESVSLPSPTTSSSSSFIFEFQPEENEELIESLKKGEYNDSKVYEKYKEEIIIMPLPKISQEDSNERGMNNKKVITTSQEGKIKVASGESPKVFVSSWVEKSNTFFLHPSVLLSLALIACLLIVAIVLKEKRTKYL